jgi:UTP--glucose-1-phosphate uridylyltransferase
MRPPITKAVIPVAGLGTRFLPATKAQPKEMLPLVDKPVIQHVVEEASQAGIQTVVFVTGRGKQAIENHFDIAFELEHALQAKGRQEELALVRDSTRMIQFAYVRQGEALGLGHAIRCTKSIAGNEPIAVLLGDDVFDGEGPALLPLLSAYARTGMAVVGLQKVPLEHVSRYGVVSENPGTEDSWLVSTIVEKPAPESSPSCYAVVGRYVLTPEVFEILETLPPGHGGEFQLTDALAVMAQRGKLMAAVIQHQRYDTGNKLDYIKACIDFALKRPEFHSELKSFLLSKALETEAAPEGSERSQFS